MSLSHATGTPPRRTPPRLSKPFDRPRRPAAAVLCAALGVLALGSGVGEASSESTALGAHAPIVGADIATPASLHVTTNEAPFPWPESPLAFAAFHDLRAQPSSPGGSGAISEAGNGHPMPLNVPDAVPSAPLRRLRKRRRGHNGTHNGTGGSAPASPAPAPKALVVGGGPLGLFWLHFLPLLGFEVWLSEEDPQRKTTIKALFKNEVRLFDRRISEHQGITFRLVVMATSSRSAYNHDLYDLLEDRGVLYLFSGIDRGDKDPLLDPQQVANFERIHRLGTYSVVPLPDGRRILVCGHSGTRATGWEEALTTLTRWGPQVSRVITGRIDNIDGDTVDVWRKELAGIVPGWKAPRGAAIESVVNPGWSLRSAHLKVTFLSRGAVDLLRASIQGTLAKEALRVKAQWKSLQTSSEVLRVLLESVGAHDGAIEIFRHVVGVRLMQVRARPHYPEPGWVLLKVIAANPCAAEARAHEGGKAGRADRVQALHNGFAIVVMTNLEPGDQRIGVGDLVVLQPHVYNDAQKASPAYRAGDFYRIQGDQHMGIDCDGPGGEYAWVPVECCVKISRAAMRGLVRALKTEHGPEAVERAASVLAELEHVACVLTGLQLLRAWAPAIGGPLEAQLRAAYADEEVAA